MSYISSLKSTCKKLIGLNLDQTDFFLIERENTPTPTPTPTPTQPVIDDITYWLGGAMYEEDVSQAFINKSIYAINWMDEDISDYLATEDGIEKLFVKHKLNNNARNMFKLFLELKAGDRIAIKSAFARGTTSVLRIKAIGTVQGNAYDSYVYDDVLEHTIPAQWEKIEQFDLENIGGYFLNSH